MNIAVLFLAILAIILFIKYMTLKKQIHNISRQIKQVISCESEKMLDISFIDSDLELLAGQINAVFAVQRSAVAKTLRHEEQLKESISGISHDLRTPLTVIIGHLQMLMGTPLLPDQLAQIETSLQKSYRLKDLINTFYDLSLMESEQLKPQLEKISFSNFFFDFMAENAPLFEHKHIHPQITMPDVSVFVLADPNMLDRILLNLITNAVHYTTGTIDIRLSVLPDSQAVFQISNPVRNPELLDVNRLFERFYTGDPSRSTESTGLGLSVVKILTEKMHGSVCASMCGTFLCLTVTFKTQ
ncbi:sensor histidine kinase [Anaerostipes sp.]|uniref:sensor histidine kinase n=1 Tax=Anaerostipes sp. TaxID=1872530 RepID=UPI0025C24BE6|nr:HAMP domain-containing sensor histidine kinase [Anaerostipes sp.]MBS7008400.1 HAMP domain-containing histidine kinase [Anaerostipes sp.]